MSFAKPICSTSITSPIPGTNPTQYHNRALDFLDHALPAIQEPILALAPGVVFAAAVDRNGYLPVHNLKYSRASGRRTRCGTTHMRATGAFSTT